MLLMMNLLSRTVKVDGSIRLSWSCKMGFVMTRMSLNRNGNRSFTVFELTTWRTSEDSNSLRGGSSVGIGGNDGSARLRKEAASSTTAGSPSEIPPVENGPKNEAVIIGGML